VKTSPFCLRIRSLVFILLTETKKLLPRKQMTPDWQPIIADAREVEKQIRQTHQQGGGQMRA
jgi:hypothetical protein